jgi:hypothetical protein
MAMPYSLHQAATACGVNKSTILRAIKAGKISAVRDEQGQWQVEPAELHRVYPPVTDAAERTDAVQRYAPADAAVLALANQRAAVAEERLSEMKAMLADMQRDRDAWRDQAQRLALPKPEPESEPKPLTWWRWLRTTGCLAGMGLLLTLAVPAGAQEQPPLPPQPLPQQQPQQQPQRACFTVEMSHSAQGNPQGSILLDRCTGKTWLLLCIRNDNVGCAFQWAPIPDATEPASQP